MPLSGKFKYLLAIFELTKSNDNFQKLKYLKVSMLLISRLIQMAQEQIYLHT